MGADFLARFLVEVLYAKHGEDALKFMSIDFSATNSANESIEANPSFSFGNNPILSVQKLLSQNLID